MFKKSDEELLLRLLGRNQVIFFAGAGFSADALNDSDENIPVGNKLSEKIWHFLELPGEYDGTSLKVMFEAMMSKGKTFEEISGFLESLLLVKEFPSYYLNFTNVIWRKIYTTNVDDLFDCIYHKSPDLHLKALKYPHDEPQEKDPTLDVTQCIYLNGKIPCRPDEIIFSQNQYAKTSLQHQPFYEEFVREYSTYCTIFLGASMEEDLIWRYVEARDSRPGRISENRPRSFLISKEIPEPKKIVLSNYNVVPIEANTEEFMNWLGSQEFPTKDDILEIIFPSYKKLKEVKGFDTHEKSIKEFSKIFEHVPSDLKVSSQRSFYLLGAAPRWVDIINELDAPREISQTIIADIEKELKSPNQLRIFTILGSAGSGKSTVLKRVALSFNQRGNLVFYTNSESVPKSRDIRVALDTFDDRTILLFDNAEVILGVLPEIVMEVQKAETPPIIIIASRTNDFDRLSGKYSKDLSMIEYRMPDLTKKEIIDLIRKLEENHLLGTLKGMSEAKRIREFEYRAKKQILVAMKETTTGKGFNEIIEDEFGKITPNEAKILCLCVALATDAGFRISIDEFVGCSKVKPAEALHYLKRNLSGIVISTGPNQDLLLVRHKLIAEHYIKSCSSISQLRESYTRILNVLAAKINEGGWRTRAFSLYKDLINHRTLYLRFSKKLDEARDIYESLKDLFSNDSNFWLQYGSLELEGGDLSLAENYLNQADSLSPNDDYVITAKGHLFMRRAVEASSYSESINLREEGSVILRQQINYSGDRSAHCYHIYCLQNYIWIKTWINDDELKKSELEELQQIAKAAVEIHPLNRRLSKLQETIQKAYLNMSIPMSERPDDPTFLADWF